MKSSHNGWFVEYEVKTKKPHARRLQKSSWQNKPLVIDGWTMEWYDPPLEEWKNVYTDKRAWPLEEAIRQLAADYQLWLKDVGWVPNIECVMRIRNVRTNEEIPVAVVM